MSNNVNGKVKWFNEGKGFGMLSTETVKEDVFVHYTEIKKDGFKTLKEGQAVSFDLVQGPKGKLAKNVCISD